ncbi:uncharacterized protein N7511_003127 [Penicillium nucicola]|uniref:uncharacterized protein n=1 Tax=Penicillium nucicola TaxID=1850975 RepID=UPI0025450E0E|nr:uncharacterized protein N7511_003127 [Penicillium nucicola]KAJ5771076.1 hypothetical protein N7511_003127 [Penicillium nucicola]
MDTIMSSLTPKVADILMADMWTADNIAMFSIGSFLALEVSLSAFTQFKSYRGFYFWSMQIAASGIVLYGVTAQMTYTRRASNIAMAVPFVLGWWCMVQGQALVLYSRLHLVVSDKCHLHWVLWMIIANFIILSIPMSGLFLCRNLSQAPQCIKPAKIYDRIQISGFAIQDVVISAIYIYEALRALKPIFEIKGREGKRVIVQLVIINVFVVILNASLFIVEWKAHYLTVSYKTVVYAIKLKLEFYILSRLRELTRVYPCVCHTDGESPRVSSDVNIFDLSARRGGRPQGLDMEAQTSPRFGGAVSPSAGLPHSTRSSTYDFHEALRETRFASTSENSVGQSHLDGRLQVHSSDTRSTVEMALVPSN